MCCYSDKRFSLFPKADAESKRKPDLALMIRICCNTRGQATDTTRQMQEVKGSRICSNTRGQATDTTRQMQEVKGSLI